jgi:hypothetical protein
MGQFRQGCRYLAAGFAGIGQLLLDDRRAIGGHWPSGAASSFSHLAAYRRVLEEDHLVPSFWKTTYRFLMTWWT